MVKKMKNQVAQTKKETKIKKQKFHKSFRRIPKKVKEINEFKQEKIDFMIQNDCENKKSGQIFWVILRIQK